MGSLDGDLGGGFMRLVEEGLGESKIIITFVVMRRLMKKNVIVI